VHYRLCLLLKKHYTSVCKNFNTSALLRLTSPLYHCTAVHKTTSYITLALLCITFHVLSTKQNYPRAAAHSHYCASPSFHDRQQLKHIHTVVCSIFIFTNKNFTHVVACIFHFMFYKTKKGNALPSCCCASLGLSPTNYQKLTLLRVALHFNLYTIVHKNFIHELALLRASLIFQ